MEINTKKFEMRVNQINERSFKLTLIDTALVNKVVYETFSCTIPSTLDLISRYNRLRFIK
jgi:hypothetical protein